MARRLLDWEEAISNQPQLNREQGDEGRALQLPPLRQHPLHNAAQVPNGAAERGGAAAGERHQGEGWIRVLD